MFVGLWIVFTIFEDIGLTWLLIWVANLCDLGLHIIIYCYWAYLNFFDFSLGFFFVVGRVFWHYSENGRNMEVVGREKHGSSWNK